MAPRHTTGATLLASIVSMHPIHVLSAADRPAGRGEIGVLLRRESPKGHAGEPRTARPAGLEREYHGVLST